MAIKGEMIDINKPLSTLIGLKVLKIKKIKDAETSHSSYFEAIIENTFIFENKSKITYTYDGFKNQNKNHNVLNLIYQDELTIQPPETKKRIIKQIISDKEGFIALSDDGNAYFMQRFSTSKKWYPIEDLPQD